MMQHFVRVGLFGHIGRFSGVDSIRYPRSARVVCRTARGLEVGQVLAPADVDSATDTQDGHLLRAMTPEDELLLARLEKNRNRAYEACRLMLDERGIQAVLMDVEHLLDGRSLYFYFLGEVTPEIESLTTELADVYETKVQMRRFAETLANGCGPGCGTEQAEGSGCTSSCGSCSIAGMCSVDGRSDAV